MSRKRRQRKEQASRANASSAQNRKAFDKLSLSETRAQYISSLEEMYENQITVNTLPAASGIFHQDVPEPILNFQYSGDEHIIGQNSSRTAAIVMAKDRPADLLTGYGRSGAMRANAIDLVVGRLSSVAGGLGPEDGSPADNDFITDAARIYISEMTDIDRNFGLSHNKGGINAKQSVAKSGIGIKADHIRIIGREGVKIVTGKAKGDFKGLGKHGELNSRGGSIILPSPKIILNAGNVTGTRNVRGNPFVAPTEIPMLQPIAMGGNVRDGFMELSELLDQLIGVVFDLTLGMNVLFGVLAVTPVPSHASACAAFLTYLATKIQGPVHHTRADLHLWQVNYLENPGYKYVCSRNTLTS